MKKKIKKIVLAVLIAASVTCSTLIPASAAESLMIDSVTVGGVALEYTMIPLSATENFPFSGVYYEAPADAADFNFNTQIVLNKGDTVTVNYTVLVSHVSGFGLFFGLGGAHFTPPLSALRKVSEGAHYTHSVTSSVTFTSTGTQTLKPFFEVNVEGNTSYDRQNVNLAVIQFSYQINNNPAVAANEAADDIKKNQDKNTQKQIDEDYGYTKPDSTETDEGINAGTNLIESLNQWIDEFNKELPTSVSHIMDDIQPFKSMVHKIFDVFPVALQYLFTFAMVFLVLRKVVGR